MMMMMSNISCLLLLLIAIISATTHVTPAAGGGTLEVGFYDSTCPSAERIVSRVVRKALSENPGLAPGIVRLHFHDFLVQGPDASILLDPVKGELEPVEKKAPAHDPGLRGFEVIDAAKSALEARCPGTVSCADILAFAARDSASHASSARNFTYKVPAGRRDGNISQASLVQQSLPPLSSDVDAIRQSFADKGLTLNETVALFGAHSFGTATCQFFSDRLYSFETNGTQGQDPSMNPGYARFLKSKCPKRGDGPGRRVNLDKVSPNTLDVQYYQNLVNRMGLLDSDQGLMSNATTAALVKEYAENARKWRRDFAAAMVKMGSLGVLTGDEGEIRKNCRLINK